ncbi:MAG: hypothetical protein U0835_06145 [Isosphaeraceae bacterium]
MIWAAWPELFALEDEALVSVSATCSWLTMSSGPALIRART